MRWVSLAGGEAPRGRSKQAQLLRPGTQVHTAPPPGHCLFLQPLNRLCLACLEGVLLALAALLAGLAPLAGNPSG